MEGFVLRAALAAVVVWMGVVAQAEADTRYVKALKVNCRAEATVDSPVVAQFARNAPVAVVYDGQGWSQIDGSLCWIRSWLLADAPIMARRERPRPQTRVSIADNLRRPDWRQSAP